VQGVGLPVEGEQRSNTLDDRSEFLPLGERERLSIPPGSLPVAQPFPENRVAAKLGANSLTARSSRSASATSASLSMTLPLPRASRDGQSTTVSSRSRWSGGTGLSGRRT
jgi:hypothetical protein